MAEVSNYINIERQHRALNLHYSADKYGKWMYINIKTEHSNKNGNVFLINLSSESLDTLFSVSSWETWESYYRISKSPNGSVRT